MSRHLGRSTRAAVVSIVAASLVVVAAPVWHAHAAPVNHVWTGTANGNLSNAFNWQDITTPVAGDSLEFPVGRGAALTDDLGAGFSISGLKFDDAGYTISPAAADTFVLTGPISDTGAGMGSDTLNVPIQLATNITITLDAAGIGLNFAGVISESLSRTLTITGAGGAFFTKANTYTGGTFVSNGTATFSASGGMGTGAVAIDNSTLNVGNGAGATTYANSITASNGISFLQNTGTQPVTLSGPLNVNAALRIAGNTMTLSGALSGAGAVSSFGIKNIQGTTAHTYSGTWTVSNAGGVLNLNDTAGTALGTNATLISGAGTGTEDVQVQRDNQLNGLHLQVNAQGTVHLGSATDSISTLIMTGGGTGGLLDLGLTGILTETGDFTATGGAAGAAHVTGGGWLFPNTTLWTVTHGSTTPDVQVDSALGGVGDVTIDGLSTGAVVTLTGASAGHTGPTHMQGGVTVIVDGNNSNSDFLPFAGSILRGTGSVGGIDPGVGTIIPGDVGPGILTTAQTYFAGPVSTYAPIINGATTAGADYSQLHLTFGIVHLTGTLTLTLGYTPAVGDKYTIIKNDGGSAVQGTFTGLPEGADFSAGGKVFTITYAGGLLNHDVVVTNIAGFPTATALSANPASPNAGQAVTFSVVVTSPSGPTPTGMVTLFDGASKVATATLDKTGNATFTFTPAAGKHSYTAVYSGDPNDVGSTSNVVSLTMPAAVTVPTPDAGVGPRVAGGVALTFGGLLMLTGGCVLVAWRRARRRRSAR